LQRWLAQVDLIRALLADDAYLSTRRATAVHQTWQGDAVDQVRLADGSLVSCLHVVDECSGAFLGSRVFPPSLQLRAAGCCAGGPTRAFSRLGLPLAMRLDNGLPWGGGAGNTCHPLALWLVGLGLELTFNPPRQPRYNGVVEKSQTSNKRWQVVAGPTAPGQAVVQTHRQGQPPSG